MDWKRIGLFVVLLFASTAAASLPFGFVAGFIAAGGGQVPAWLTPAQAAANLAAAGCVFGLLAKRQVQRAHHHAWAVLLLTWLVSYPLNVLMLGVPNVVWFLGVVPLAVSLYVGLAIGSRLRSEPPEMPPAT